MIRYVKCDRCDKTGKVHAGSAYGQKFESVCPKCDGEGIIDLLTKSQWQIHKERIFLFTFLLTLVLGALLVAMTSQVVFVIVLSIVFGVIGAMVRVVFIGSTQETRIFMKAYMAEQIAHKGKNDEKPKRQTLVSDNELDQDDPDSVPLEDLLKKQK